MDAVAGVTRRVTLPEASDRTRVLRVVDRQTVAHDENVVALTFAAADGEPLPRWHPGAHIDVHLPSGRLRQYSLCGDPGVYATSYRIAVRRIPDGGGGSIEVHDVLDDRCDSDDAGPAQRVPADRSRLRFADTAIPVHRGRHRDHPDPADAGSGPAPRRRLVDGLRRTHARQPAVPRRGRTYSATRCVSTPTTTHGLPTAPDLLGDCPDGTAVYACGPAPDADRHPVGIGRPRQSRTSLRAVRRATRRGRQGVRRHGRVDRTTDPRRRRRDPARGTEPVGCARAVLLSAGFLRDVPDAGGRCQRRGPWTTATRCSPTPSTRTR